MPFSLLLTMRVLNMQFFCKYWYLITVSLKLLSLLSFFLASRLAKVIKSQF